MAINANVENLHVYGDSLLVINQVTHKWKINNTKLKEIHAQIIPLLSHFHTIQFSHVKRNLNKRADELANEALNNRNLM
jgi:ribonuclease HI